MFSAMALLMFVIVITLHMTVWNVAATDECASSPCGLGTCVDGNNSYSCLCLPGAVGIQCQFALTSFCAPETCHHVGTCVMGVQVCDLSQNISCTSSNSSVHFGSPWDVEAAMTVDCVCYLGYTGLNCETEIDECASSPCVSGDCIDGIGNYSCLCPPNVLGPQCQFSLVDYCTADTCQQGGSCDLATQVCDFSNNVSCTTGDDPVYLDHPFNMEVALTASCLCPLGYTGLHCEREVDECQSNPCRNNGTCLDQFAGFLCLCTSQYSGELCHVPQPPCQYMDILCANGGTCEDHVTTCNISDPDNCPSAWSEGQLTYCMDKDNVTECSSSSTGFVCHCVKGWDGLYCENDIDECLPGPCDNGGSCTHGIGYFHCECPLPYYGLRCEARTACGAEPCVNWGVCADSLAFCSANCFLQSNCTQGPENSTNLCQPQCGQNSSDPLCGQMFGENPIQYGYDCLCPEPYFGGVNCEIIYSCPCAHKLSPDGASCEPLVSAPKLEILCVQNCSKRRAVNRTLSLWVSCENCDPATQYSYYWSVNTTIDWQINTTTGNSAPGISILGGVLLPPQTYLFSVKVWNSSCQFVYNSTWYSITLGDPPFPGQCEVSPSSGTVLVDEFSMSCEGFHDEDWPLLYSFYYSQGNTDLTLSYGSVLSVRATPFLPSTPLSLASAATNYTGYLTVKCSDYYGSSVAMHYPVQVLPVSDPAQLRSLADDVIVSANGNQSNPNKMEALLETGDTDGALNLALTFTSALNSMELGNAEPLSSRLQRREVSQDVIQMRSGIVDTLVSINTSSPENVQQKALAMKEITSQTAELTQAAQDSAVTSFSNLTKSLKQMVQDADDNINIKPSEVISDLLEGSFQILRQATGDTMIALNTTGSTESTSISPGQQAAKTRSKEITRSSMEVMDNSATILLDRMVPGEINRNVGKTTGSVSMALARDSAQRLRQTSLSVEASGAQDGDSGGQASGVPAGEFSLPLMDTGSGSQGDLLGIQAYHLPENPYAWDESARDLRAAVIGLKVTSNGDQDVCLVEPVNFSLPLTAQDVEYALVGVEVGNSSSKFNLDDVSPGINISDITTSDLSTVRMVVPGNRDYMVIIDNPGMLCLNETMVSGLNITAGGCNNMSLDGGPSLSQEENSSVGGLPSILSVFVMLSVDVKPTLAAIQSLLSGGQYLSICINPLETLVHNATTVDSQSITSIDNMASLRFYTHDIGSGEVRLFGRTGSENQTFTMYLTLLWDHSLPCLQLSRHLSYNDTNLGLNITNGTVVEDVYNLTSLMITPPGIKTVSIATSLPQCLYWDEEGDKWSGEGCWVSPQTTMSHLHCQCSHLTAFSGGIFVVPNLIDPIGDIKLFLTVLDNPVVVSIVVLVWIIYILLVLWARRKDRLDFVQVGVTELEDNNPSDRHCYLVTVLTGWQGGAGTTSTVTLTLVGSQARSAPHVLTDPHRILFQAAAENWFLIRCPHSLGDLISVDIWHDCSGPFPQWFMTQTTVKDIETAEEWHFVCNKWLTPAKPWSVRQIIKPLSKPKDQPFTYRFSVKAAQTIRDQHLWLSIFMRPPHSSFTRVQRLSCGLSFILTAMLTNLMFYGRGDDPEDMLEVRDIQISLSQIVIGIQAAFIAIPVNMLIVYLFRNARFKQTSLAETSPAHSLDSIESISDRDSQSWCQSDSLSDHAGTQGEFPESPACDVTDAAASREYKRRKTIQERTGRTLSSYPGAANNLHISGNSLTPQRKTNLITSTPVRTVSTKSVTISENSEVHVRGSEYPQSSKKHVGTYPLRGILREQDTSFISLDGLENDASMQSIVLPFSDSLLEDALEDDTMISCHSSSASFHSALEKDPQLLGLPWWCRNLAWVIVIITAVVFSYFVMLYGLKFGYAKSVAWCVSFFTSFFKSAGVVQPLKVALITAIFSLIFIEPVRPQWNQINFRPLKQDEIPLHSCIGLEEEVPIPRQLYRPPNQQTIQAVAERIKRERKMWNTFYDTALYLLFATILYSVAYGHTHPLAYRNTKAVENMIFSGSYSSAIVLFKTVRTKEHLWDYLEETLVPALITTDPPYTVDNTNVILGRVRLRQQRVKQGYCQLSPVLSGVFGKTCVSDLDSKTQDVANYSPEWKVPPSYNTENDTGFRYSEGEGDSIKGWYRQYRSGGYIIDIPLEHLRALEEIKQLRNMSWADGNTRAVLVEFTIFNPATKLFMATTLVFEFLTTGAVMPYFSMFTCKLMNLTKFGDLYTLLAEVFYMMMVIVYMYKEAKKASSCGMYEYFSDPWSWLQIVIILLSWLAFTGFIYRLVLVSRLLSLYKSNSGNVFIPIHKAVVWDRLLTYLLAAISVLVTVYFTRLLKFNRRMLVLGESVRQCLKPVLTYFLIVILTISGFLGIGLLTLGPFCEDYGTVAQSLMSIMSISLRQSSLHPDECLDTKWLMALVYTTGVGITFTAVFIPLLQTILFSVLATKTEWIHRLQGEFQMLDFVWARFLVSVGLWRLDKFTEHVEKEVEQGTKRLGGLGDLRQSIRNWTLWDRMGAEAFHTENLKNEDTLADAYFANVGFSSRRRMTLRNISGTAQVK